MGVRWCSAEEDIECCCAARHRWVALQSIDELAKLCVEHRAANRPPALNARGLNQTIDLGDVSIPEIAIETTQSMLVEGLLYDTEPAQNLVRELGCFVFAEAVGVELSLRENPS